MVSHIYLKFWDVDPAAHHEDTNKETLMGDFDSEIIISELSPEKDDDSTPS